MITWEDSLLAHHCFASHLPKSLSHVASVYCDAEPWKILHGKSAGEEKGEAPWESDDVSNLLLYCCKDVRLTALAWQRMKPDLAPERKVYESDKRMALLCRGMTEVGIGFDTAKRDELASHLRARKRGLLGEMRQLVGPGFHPARLGDVRRALFVTFRGPMLYPTKTGLASTSNLTLEAVKVLDTRAGHLADLLLRWRACAKTLGSYVENYEPGRDGRIHAQWKLGPVTGRLAGPLMTLPRYGDDWETHVRGMYVADKSKHRSRRPRIVAQIHDAAIIEFDGQLFYYDLSQCEARLAAYFSGDENLIKACEKDIHTENAKVVFADIPEAMAKLNKAYELSPFLDNHGKPLKWKAVTGKNGGCKDERDITKNCGFCVWYEGTAERALATLKAAGKRATLAACEEFVRRFHSRYTRYYEFIDENEAFCRQHGYLRSVILGRIRWLGWHAKRTDVSNCLDEDTEALTRRGWVRGFDLRKGDQLLTRNIQTGDLEWKPISGLKLYPRYTGPLVKFESRSFNAVTTPQHQWSVIDRKKFTTLRTTTEELAKGLGTYAIHRTGTYIPKHSPVYSDDFVELAGWVLTDGSVRLPRGGGKGVKRAVGISIYQSVRGNPQKVKRIDALFSRLGASPDRRQVAHGGVVWLLAGSSNLPWQFASMFPDRTMTPQFLLSLTRPQLNLLLEVMMLGDGSRAAGGHNRFCCRDDARAHIFQFLCTLCGIATSARWRGPKQPKKQYASIANRPKSRGIWIITLLCRDTAQVLSHKKRYGKNLKRVEQVEHLPEGVERKVWCPVVPNTFFVARRFGDVFITGNTPIQGGIADIHNDRLPRIEDRLPGCKNVDQLEKLVRDVWAEPIKVPHNGLEFVMPIDFKTGERWSDFG